MDILSYLQPGWNLRLGTQRLVIDAPNEVAAYDLLTNAAEELASSVANLRFKDAQIYWKGCRKPLRVVAAMAQTSTPEIPDMVFSRHIGFGVEELRTRGTDAGVRKANEHL